MNADMRRRVSARSITRARYKAKEHRYLFAAEFARIDVFYVAYGIQLLDDAVLFAGLLSAWETKSADVHGQELGLCHTASQRGQPFFEQLSASKHQHISAHNSHVSRQMLQTHEHSWVKVPLLKFRFLGVSLSHSAGDPSHRQVAMDPQRAAPVDRWGGLLPVMCWRN